MRVFGDALVVADTASRRPDQLLRMADPSRAALATETDVISYGQFDARVDRFVQIVSELGVRQGDRVAYLGRNTDLFCYAIMGCMRAGVVLLPVNWRLAPSEIAYILTDGAAELVIVDPEFDAALDEALATSTSKPRRLQTEGQADVTLRAMIAANGTSQRQAETAHGDVVCIQMYTSGTTGHPKGVLITQAGLALSCYSQIQHPKWPRLTSDDSVLIVTPLFHIAAITLLLDALVAGGTIVLTVDSSPQKIAELCSTHAIAQTLLVSTLVRALVEEVKAKGSDLESLKSILYGAAPIEVDLLREAIVALGCEFAQSYGMTETAGPVTLLAPDDHDEARPHLLRSVGRPLPGVGLDIRRPDGTSCAPDEHGEIWVSTPTMAAGYWNQPDANLATFVDGWFRSGDGGFLDGEGFLYMTDRVSDTIISGGENVYPVQIEELYRDHPAVADVVVVGMPDPHWGEAVTALILPRSTATITEAEMLSHAQGKIAKYKIPKRIVITDAIPRTASNKLQRKKARDMLLQRDAASGSEATPVRDEVHHD